ncbi:MAG: hypothetical protein OFPI_27680 [Osedax symbiont Rs2]|nr:MAG: hypothetical protein OFPI_27680 [Osedax symbiont Rs2]
MTHSDLANKRNVIRMFAQVGASSLGLKLRLYLLLITAMGIRIH